MRDKKTIEVKVSSYGRVVPKDFWGKIFEKYVRGPGAAEINQHGMGLGLYIAQEIAKAHGFKIYYEAISTDGVSGQNNFYFQIPVCGYEG